MRTILPIGPARQTSVPDTSTVTECEARLPRPWERRFTATDGLGAIATTWWWQMTILATDCDDRNAVRANIVGATESVVTGRRRSAAGMASGRKRELADCAHLGHLVYLWGGRVDIYPPPSSIVGRCRATVPDIC